MNRVGIGSDSGLSPVRRQAIIETNAMLLPIGPLGTNFSEFSNQNSKLFIHEIASENIVCQMAAILSRGRWVNASSGLPNPISVTLGLYRPVYDVWSDFRKAADPILDLTRLSAGQQP